MQPLASEDSKYNIKVKQGPRQALLIFTANDLAKPGDATNLVARLRFCGWVVTTYEVTRDNISALPALIAAAGQEAINGKDGALLVYFSAHGQFYGEHHYMLMGDVLVTLNQLLQSFSAQHAPRITGSIMKFFLVDACSGIQNLDMRDDFLAAPFPTNTVVLYASPPGIDAFTGLKNQPSQLMRAFLSGALSEFNERWQASIERVVRQSAVEYLLDRQTPNLALPPGHEDQNTPVYLHKVEMITGFPEFAFWKRDA
jgi:hypothetical protein